MDWTKAQSRKRLLSGPMLLGEVEDAKWIKNGNFSRGNKMIQTSIRNSFLGVLVLLVGSSFAISTYPQIALAQTQGMQRRDERRDTRQTSRAVKHECNASGQASRSGCRQAKRHTKQAGRHD